MNLSREWDNRLNLWIEKIQKDFFILIGEVACAGFTTYDMLAPEEAKKGAFQPMPPGTAWGEKWQYGWFRTEITLPDFANGKRIIFSPDVGGEMLIWVNGTLAGSKDLEHSYITLTKCAEGGEHYDILIESYAGHGPRLENGGPYFPGETPVPEPPQHQVTVGHAVIAIWNEPAYQAGLDAYTLHKLLRVLDGKSLRAQKVLEALKQFTYLVDFELPLEQRMEGYYKARELLRPLLACVNGSTAPEFTVFGQSHLDLAWKWTFDETKRKCARTLSSQLALMDEYPEYRFMVCQVPILETVKRCYPELYVRILEKIRNGQMMPEGGVYVENDTNIPNGESLIRQFLYGKQWYREEYGCDSKMAWMPDTFGFSAALPQIMKGCGIDYFATQKLVRSHPETDRFPYNIFYWEGIDGTSVLSHMLMENNSGIDPELLSRRWNEDRNQQENIETFLFPFGYGDGGGGPTRDIYELAKRVGNLEGAPKTILQSPIDFFADAESRGLPIERYVGELYLQWHRGTYTSVAALKRGNRAAETALHDMEFWSAAASRFLGLAYPKAEITALWKKLLFNQFHDILAGTSITRVNEQAIAAFSEILDAAGQMEARAHRALAGEAEAESLTVFNTLSWPREELVPLPEGYRAARDGNGNDLFVQTTGDSAIACVHLPPMGYASFTLMCGEGRRVEQGGSFAYREGDLTHLENEKLKITFLPTGQIISILDKESGRNLARGLCNDFRMYKDVNIEYDAWELGTMYRSLPVDLGASGEVQILCGADEKGLLASIEITREIHNSSVRQVVSLRRGSSRVDFLTHIVWKEMHKILKVEFPVEIHADEGISEIQFGYVKRPTHRTRQYDKDRFEVPQQKYTCLAEAGRGVAILNDCKYGVSLDGSSINLTLLKAPVIPDMYADQGEHTITYSLYVYHGAFADSGVVQNAYELNYPAKTLPGGRGERSFLRLLPSEDSPARFLRENVIIESVKEAEDTSGDWIVRLYESQNTASGCVLQADVPVAHAFESDMLELCAGEIPVGHDGVKLWFRPFEIKTIRLKFDRREVEQ